MDGNDGYGLLFFMALFPIGLAFGAYALVQNKKRTDAWHALAQQSGLASAGSWPTVSMTGNLAGAAVNLRQWITRSGGGKHRHTSYHVRGEARVGRDLAGVIVYEQTWMSTIGSSVFGMQDLTIGDPDFDGKFVVKAADAEVARRVLDPATRRALLDTFRLLGSVGIEGNCVVYQASRAIEPPRAIEILLGLSTCAATLGGA